MIKIKTDASTHHNIVILLRVTADILAMARPNTDMIHKKKLIQQFKE